MRPNQTLKGIIMATAVENIVEENAAELAENVGADITKAVVAGVITLAVTAGACVAWNRFVVPRILNRKNGKVVSVEELVES